MCVCSFLAPIRVWIWAVSALVWCVRRRCEWCGPGFLSASLSSALNFSTALRNMAETLNRMPPPSPPPLLHLFLSLRLLYTARLHIPSAHRPLMSNCILIIKTISWVSNRRKYLHISCSSFRIFLLIPYSMSWNMWDLKKKKTSTNIPIEWIPFSCTVLFVDVFFLFFLYILYFLRLLYFLPFNFFFFRFYASVEGHEPTVLILKTLDEEVRITSHHISPHPIAPDGTASL